jgi:hypothetical protein
VYAVALLVPQFFTNNGFVLDGLPVTCTFDYLSRDFYTRLCMLIMVVCGFFIPILTIITFTIITKLALKNRDCFLQDEILKNLSARRSRSVKFDLTTTIGQMRTIMDYETAPDVDPMSTSIIKRHDNVTHVDQGGCSTDVGVSSTMRKKDSIIKLKRLTSTSTNTSTITCPVNEVRLPPISSNLNLNLNSPPSTSNVAVSERNIVLLQNIQFSIMKRIIMSVICFVLAWSPYVFIVLYAQFGSNVEAIVNPLSASLPAMLAKSSSIYNPILYTISNKECRDFFRKKFF